MTPSLSEENAFAFVNLLCTQVVLLQIYGITILLLS